jgi:cytoskeletal protein RodZ
MRKEVAMAILLGFGIGLLIAFAIITARTALSQQAGSTNQVEPTSLPEDAATPETKSVKHTLTISSPADNDVVNDAEATVTGSTSPASSIAITTEQKDIIAEANDSGKFSQNVPLIGGANLIRIVSFSPSGERAEAEVTVVYTTAEF